MREIHCSKVIKAVTKLCKAANFCLPQSTYELLEKALNQEDSTLGKMVLDKIFENAGIALKEEIPLCQDCGSTIVFVEIGNQVQIKGGILAEAINEGVRLGYKEGYLRKSICHPISRKNTGDNTPAVIHIDIVKGNSLKIIVMPKGGGSENMAKLKMLSPSAGKKGIVDFVVKSVEEAGSNPCPPIIIGLGIGGGSAERAMFLAKKALLRKVGETNPDPEIAELEKEILKGVNNLKIGPQGFGGKITALACYIEVEPCHIASLPLAVNLQCHSARYAEVIL